MTTVYHYAIEQFKTTEGVDLINAFSFKLERTHINRLINAGFWRWNYNTLYCHEIVLEDNKDNIGRIRVDSNPAQCYYYDKFWWKFTNVEKGQLEVAQEAFRASSQQYQYDQGFKVANNVEEFLNSKMLPLIAQKSAIDYVRENILYGHKDEFASHTPHLVIETINPLIITNSYNI